MPVANQLDWLLLAVNVVEGCPPLVERNRSQEEKLQRIAKKVRKVLEILVPEPRPDPFVIEARLRECLERIPNDRLQKKTIPVLAAAVSLAVIRMLGFETTSQEVVAAIESTNPGRLLVKRARYRHCLNRPEEMATDRMAELLAPVARESVLELAVQLCNRLQSNQAILDTVVLHLVPAAGEHHSLASRHRLSVAATLVLMAYQMNRVDMTLSHMTRVSGVSPGVIRKAQWAVRRVLAQPLTVDNNTDEGEE